MELLPTTGIALTQVRKVFKINRRQSSFTLRSAIFLSYTEVDNTSSTRYPCRKLVDERFMNIIAIEEGECNDPRDILVDQARHLVFWGKVLQYLIR